MEHFSIYFFLKVLKLLKFHASIFFISVLYLVMCFGMKPVIYATLRQDIVQPTKNTVCCISSFLIKNSYVDNKQIMCLREPQQET